MSSPEEEGGGRTIIITELLVQSKFLGRKSVAALTLHGVLVWIQPARLECDFNSNFIVDLKPKCKCSLR